METGDDRQQDKNKQHMVRKREQTLNYYMVLTCLYTGSNTPQNLGGCPRGVMVKAMDCGIVGREFVLQSRYYVHFRTKTPGKDMNPLIVPAMG